MGGRGPSGVVGGLLREGVGRRGSDPHLEPVDPVLSGHQDLEADRAERDLVADLGTASDLAQHDPADRVFVAIARSIPISRSRSWTKTFPATR